jgi:protocatechuate 3,4-dioxygenase beta subunit
MRARDALAFVVVTLILLVRPLAATTTGCVLSFDGEPVVDAEIRVHRCETSFERYSRLAAGTRRPLLESTRSDQSGSFILERDCQPGDEVRIVAPGFAPFITRPTGPCLVSAVLQAAPTVTGSVRTAQGEAVAGAVVYWLNTHSGAYWSGVTGDNGRYQVPDPASWAEQVAVFHPSFGLEMVLVGEERYGTEARKDWANIELGERTWTQGTVVGPEGPVAGALISGGCWPLARTDADGRFRVATQEGISITASHGTRVASIWAGYGDSELVLEQGRKLRGLVVEEGSDTALAYTRIQVGIWPYAYNPLPCQVLTDQAGVYEVANLSPGMYVAYLAEPGFSLPESRHQEVDLRQHQSAELHHRVARDPIVRGNVVDEEGKPVRGAIVKPVRGERFLLTSVPGGNPSPGAFTDCAGHFEMVAPGQGYGSHLMALKKGFAPAASPYLNRGATGGLTFTLRRGVPLTGVVKGLRGAPLSGVKIIAAGAGYRSTDIAPAAFYGISIAKSCFYESAADGTFEIPIDDGQWDLFFVKSGFSMATVTGFAASEHAVPLEVILEPLQSLAGRVVHADGSAVAGAEVLVVSELLASEATTNSDGEFKLDLEPGTYQVRVSDEASGASAGIAVTVPGRAVTVTLPEVFSATGRVIDRASGDPIARAQVTAEAVGRAGIHEVARTDSDGRFTIKGLAGGRYEIDVSAAGFLNNDDRLEIVLGGETPESEITIALDEGLKVSGTIRDIQGEPIAGAEVVARRRSASSDELGAFMLAGLRPGEITLRISRKGFVPASRDLELEQDVSNLEIELERGYQLQGRVEDLMGEPIAEVGVVATPAGPDGERRLWERSDDSGSFILTGMSAGSWKLSARHMGFEPAEIEGVDPSRQKTVTLVLSRKPTGTIVGSVTGVTEPQLVRIRVQVADSWFDRTETRAEADGTYRIDDFPAGAVKAYAISHTIGGQRYELEKRADLAPGGETRIDFDFESRFEVRGRVTRGGRPVFGATLYFFSGDINSVETDANGDYSLELLPGSYSLDIELLYGSSQSRHLDVDGPAVFDIEVEGITVDGLVVDRATGEPVAGTEVVIELGSTGWSDESEVRTGSTGIFHFEDLMPAPYLLKASHPDYVQWRQELDLGAGETQRVQVVLEKAEGLLVSLVDARSGDQLTGTVVAHDMAGRLVFDGKPRYEGWAVRLPLPPGSYKVSASANSYATRTVETSVPSDKVVIGLTPGGTLVVRSAQLRTRRTRLVLPSGEDYIRCWCNRIAEMRLDDMINTFENIAAGNYTLVVHEPDKTTSEYPVTILEGQRTELSIQ